MSTTTTFDELVTDLDYPMFIVTAAADGERAGCLVGFATQSSIDPPRLTVWVSEANRTSGIAAKADRLAVHVLRESDGQLAARFGAETGDDVDKFADIRWSPADDGTPIIAGCDYVLGRIVQRLDGLGDHYGYVLEPQDGERLHAGLPQLGYQRIRGMSPGHPA
jgi:flavin reductase (DIM6/NTAB) family NADH-FMN oxidoreductase RutF